MPEIIRRESGVFDRIDGARDTNAKRHYPRMIRSFRCRETRGLFDGRLSRRFPRDVQMVAARKLEVLDAATDIGQLRIPPGNRLEKLAGNRAGEYSIRVNRQWRICFRWVGSDAFDVELTDYH
jgi:proteic killer suppression protein